MVRVLMDDVDIFICTGHGEWSRGMPHLKMVQLQHFVVNKYGLLVMTKPKDLFWSLSV